MRLNKLIVACILLFAAVGLSGKAQDTAKLRGRESPYLELNKVPEKFRAKPNPLAKDGDAPLAGRVLFEEHCAECHGETADGTKKAPSLKAAEVQNATPGTLFWILSNGVVRKGMPVWSKLPEPQRWQLVSYLKSLGAVSAERKEAGSR